MAAGLGAIIHFVRTSGSSHYVMNPWPDPMAIVSAATTKDARADLFVATKCREDLQQNGVVLGVDFLVEVAELLCPL
jgi:hypothetical protein